MLSHTSIPSSTGSDSQRNTQWVGITIKDYSYHLILTTKQHNIRLQASRAAQWDQMAPRKFKTPMTASLLPPSTAAHCPIDQMISKLPPSGHCSIQYYGYIPSKSHTIRRTKHLHPNPPYHLGCCPNLTCSLMVTLHYTNFLKTPSTS